MAIWPPKLGTLYKVPSELFSWLKSCLSPQGFAHNTIEQWSFSWVRRNSGWRSVFEFRGENLTVLRYFCSGFDTTRFQIDGKIRYVAIFFLFEKNMPLMSIKCAFTWWYFCIGPRLCRLVQRFWRWNRSTVVSPHAFVSDPSRGPCCGPDFKLCLLYSLTDNGKAARFPPLDCVVNI